MLGDDGVDGFIWSHLWVWSGGFGLIFAAR